MNGFEMHNYPSLSASAINLFAANQAMWVLEKLLKMRLPVGASAHRGSAAEAGIVAGLLDPTLPIEDCQAIALREFDRLTALSADPRKTKEREAVPKIVAYTIPELREYGIPDQVQTKVERIIPGVPIPFVGYIDLGWSQHGITLDIKSALKVASEISVPHARQVSIYVTGTNNEGRVAYCGPSKMAVYRLDDVAQHIADVANIAKIMERFLSISPDPKVLAGIVCPDFSSFYWSNPMALAQGRQTFGFASPTPGHMAEVERSPAAPTAGNVYQGDF